MIKGDANSRELYYRNGDAVMVAPVITDPAFSAESPRVLFRGIYQAANFMLGTLELNNWDLSPDGKRFLMIKDAVGDASTGAGSQKINIVLNWTEELKERIPAK